MSCNHPSQDDTEKKSLPLFLKHFKILNQIFKLAPEPEPFLTGACWDFAQMLLNDIKDFCPGARILYNTIAGHFVIENDGILYDASGVYSHHYPKESFVDFSTYYEIDPLHARRIWRDCILKLPSEKWDTLPEEPWKAQ